MKLPIKRIILFISFIVCSIHSIAQDSIDQKLDPIPLNYNVDRFEHALFFDVTPVSDNPIVIGTIGYDFIYNFSKKFRFIPGFGFTYGAQSLGFSPRAKIQFGSRAIRLEIGGSFYSAYFYSNQWYSSTQSWHKITRNYSYGSFSLGGSVRHGRTLELGFGWEPIFPNNEFGDLINFNFRMRIIISSKKRRKELGPWKGRHPFTNYEQQLERHNRKKTPFNYDNANYNVDRLEHVLFTDFTYGAKGFAANVGYEIVVNFMKKFRLISGLGGSFNIYTYAFTPRMSVQFGEKLTRLEVGVHSQIKGSYHDTKLVAVGIGPSVGVRFRPSRIFETGLSWNPSWEIESENLFQTENQQNFSPLINFQVQLRFYIINRASRNKLGEWKGKRPFGNQRR